MPAKPLDPIDVESIAELEIVRLIQAPRSLVFKAWTDPKQLSQWWGPLGFSCPVSEWDARPGGTIRVEMQATDGTRYPMGGNYELIEEPRRLVLYTQALHADGSILLRNRVTVTFEEVGAKTRQTLRVKVVQATQMARPMVEGHSQGWSESLLRLGILLDQLRPFTLSREFGAPRKLLYAAHTDTGHLGRWFCPAGCTVIHAAMELRAGGEYRYGLRLPNGSEMWGKQSYVYIQAPELLAYIQAFTDKDGSVIPNPMSPVWPLEIYATLAFEELGATRSRLTITWKPLHASDEQIAAFDAAHGAMVGGFKGTFDMLEQYLKTL